MNALAVAGHDNQSASGIPAGGVLITGGLSLRCNRELSRRPGFSRNHVRNEPPRSLNGYALAAICV